MQPTEPGFLSVLLETVYNLQKIFTNTLRNVCTANNISCYKAIKSCELPCHMPIKVE